MEFLIGFLELKDGESVLVGDPCYLDGTPRGIHEVELDWPAGHYPVYVELEDTGLMGNRVVRLRLWKNREQRNSYQNVFEDVVEAGVDSGQMLLAAAGVRADWKPDFETFDPDTLPSALDYEAACRATLNTALRADLLRTRRTGRLPGRGWASGYGFETATAFACSSGFGDGVYPVSVVRQTLGETQPIVGLSVDFHWADLFVRKEEDHA